MKKILATVVVSLYLTGCVALDAVVVTAQALDTDKPKRFDALQTVKTVPGQKIYATQISEMVRGGFSGKHSGCKADTLIVDYARDWDEIDEETGKVRVKATPDKIYSQAVLAYRFTCEGAHGKAMLMTTDRKTKILVPASKKLTKDETLFMRDWYTLPDSKKPQWMPQVIRTIQAEAATNPAAQDFLDNVKIGEDGLPVIPESLGN